MRVLPGGCRVFDSADGEVTTVANWTCRRTICRRNGAQHIAQFINDYRPGRAPAVVNPGAEEVLYVVRGEGACHMSGFTYRLSPGVGVYVPAATEYIIENEGPDSLTVVSVCCPEDDRRQLIDEARPRAAASGEPPPRTVREQDRSPLRAGADREFKLLVDRDLGCQRVTQFIGFIPPSRAPFHYHTYEEAIFILQGRGIVHVEGGSAEFGPGTSIFLPIGVRHCLENPGTAPVRLLGVFYPSGSPRVAYED